MDLQTILANNEALATAVNCFWLFMGGILVFLMQTGFAMVEAGFTRSKNTGNIIMKNIVDFMFGSLIYWFIGYGLMYGEGNGFIGIPFGGAFMNGGAAVADMDYTTLFFQTVFCATSATIVSGAMAERTKFSAYCFYSVMISLFIYPIAGHWIWGGGWLSELGFHDFAGSGIVHSVGGILSFVGAAILGPRIGKYGKDGKARAIPGHSIILGALGVLLLWVGWFGFNPASTGALVSVEDGVIDAAPTLLAAKVFITTNLGACAAAVVAMFFTWIRYGKPDVSMTLNGILAGLVAITAPCDCVSPVAAIIIGAIGGVLVCVAVPFIDTKLKIDDPVGAISVHGVCGIWGIIAVGLFASDPASGVEMGLFAGGGLHLLGVQLLGQLSLIVWCGVIGTVMFGLLKKFKLLRAEPADELAGLDPTEHGLPSAYPDFMPAYKD
ncbi:MAG: ammonium transporter [Oscillospiraceae bacterium]|nr:ammonium transporter [Oscillospiraceae bacterium]